MANIQLRQKTDLSSFRRIAIGTWRTVGDPSVYGSLDLRVDEALRYIEAFRAATGRRLTLSHMMAKAIGQVLYEEPDANALMRFNRIYLRDQIKVFFQVAMEDPVTGELDVSGTTVDDPHVKSLVQLVDDFQAHVDKVRAMKDEQLEGTRQLFKKIPYFFLNAFLWILGFLSYTLNLDLRRIGVPKDAFGSVMITNIGSLGLEEAYVPLVPYSRVPLLVATGAVREVPVVEDGKIVAAKKMKVSATFDHRILDGAHAAVMAKVLRRWIEHPFDHFDKLDAPALESA